MKHLDSIDVSPSWVDGIHWPTMNMDSAQGLLFARQLEHVSNVAFNNKYPALKARDIFPVSHEVGNGAETYTYYSYDAQGEFELITDYRKDFYAISQEGSKESIYFESFGRLLTWSVQDLRAAEMAGVALSSFQVTAARRMWEEKIEQVVLSGHKNSRLSGVMTNNNIPTATATGPLAAAADGAAQYDILVPEIIAMSDNTNGVELPTNVYLPLAQYNLISKTDFSANYNGTVKDKIMETCNVVVEPWTRLTASKNGNDAMLIMNKSNENAELMISQEFELGAPQPENMAFSVTAHGRTAGLAIRYPLSLRVVESI